MKNYQWQPGNGSNYDINMGEHNGKVLLCWMHRGGSGGDCMQFGLGSFLHWSYMAEKMRIDNWADLAGILALVHGRGYAKVGMPEGFGLDGLNDKHRRVKAEAE